MIGEPDIDSLSLILACAFLNKCFIPISESENLENIQVILNRLPSNALVGCCQNISGLDLYNAEMPSKFIWHIWNNKTKSLQIYLSPF